MVIPTRRGRRPTISGSRSGAADSVKNWLITREGLKDVDFETQGFGAKDPVAPNTNPDGSDNPDGRQKNRRVVIIVKKG